MLIKNIITERNAIRKNAVTRLPDSVFDGINTNQANNNNSTKAEITKYLQNKQLSASDSYILSADYGVLKNCKSSLYWYQQFIQKSNVKVGTVSYNYLMGEFYSSDAESCVDIKLATYYFHLAAKQNSAAAYNALANLLDSNKTNANKK